MVVPGPAAMVAVTQPGPGVGPASWHCTPAPGRRVRTMIIIMMIPCPECGDSAIIIAEPGLRADSESEAGPSLWPTGPEVDG
jgi:hypothetical protein